MVLRVFTLFVLISLCLGCSEGLQTKKLAIKDSKFVGFYVKTDSMQYLYDINNDLIETKAQPGELSTSEISLLNIDQNGKIIVTEFSELNKVSLNNMRSQLFPIFADTAELNISQLGTLDQTIKDSSKVNISPSFINHKVDKTLKELFAFGLDENSKSEDDVLKKSGGFLRLELGAIYKAQNNSIEARVDDQSLKITVQSKTRIMSKKFDEQVPDSDLNSANFPIESSNGLMVTKYEKISAEDYQSLLGNLTDRISTAQSKLKIARKAIGHWISKANPTKGLIVTERGEVLYGYIQSKESNQFIAYEELIGYARLNLDKHSFSLIIKDSPEFFTKYESLEPDDGQINVLGDDSIKVSLVIKKTPENAQLELKDSIFTRAKDPAVEKKQ